MTLGAEKDWREEFGLDRADTKLFFADKSDVARRGGPASQAHVIRHAFDLLSLDGALCTEHAPLVYFKKVHRIDATAVAELHRKFWNHGGAPVLALITRDDVHIYSGLVRPVAQTDHTGSIPALVDTLRRASAELRELLPAMESGEFFRRHAASFEPVHRVDRALLDNLEATRQELLDNSAEGLDTRVLDALLCRLVFACYLFDRGVIGPSYLHTIGVKGEHLRDVLAVQPRSKAWQSLYALFEKLGEDFNGDLFRADLAGEARLVAAAHIGTLGAFFHGTDVTTGQHSFWPYDFSAIPVEVISAIYERFLQSSERSEGAFYTPRFLAEAVLDVALGPTHTLLDRRYLDPACGSGIFLVGLFNRMAEEWKRTNPNVRNKRRAQELRKILCNNLHGIDINLTACRITAFSLYLAYLDQLEPRDIQELQEKGHKLPRLVHEGNDDIPVEGNIWHGDFFDEHAPYPVDVDLVIGNPPWGSTAVEGTPAAKWCSHPSRKYPLPDKQIATAFIWKTAHHARETGRISLVLPHGTLFNHSKAALKFQKAFIARYAVDHVLNLTDYQFFLFAEARHPAVVITYRPVPPASPHHSVEYWAPKTDWLVKRAELMTITPEDRSTITIGDVLDDLQSLDAPQIWKQHYWTTARDRRFVERLGLYSRLRDHVRQVRERDSKKRWLIAEGFQPAGEDDLAEAVKLQLPSHLFVKATLPALDMVLRPHDCEVRSTTEVLVRKRSNKVTAIFREPHVLVAKGFTRAAFADFDVSFQHAVRGITGPKSDQARLAFLAAYLRSSLARYFLFHTSTNWGVSRQEVHVEELLRLPFPMPEEMPDPGRAEEIVREVEQIVARAAASADKHFVDRTDVVRRAGEATEPLIAEYFDLVAHEKALVDDTVGTVIPSVRPTLKRKLIPTIEPAGERDREEYTERLCETLNGWAKRGSYKVRGHSVASLKLGVGIALLQKMAHGSAAPDLSGNFSELLGALDELRRSGAQRLNTFELLRGAKVFDGDRLYVVKPISRRFWTLTAALNDADEIASTILMHSVERPA
ncbi:MAG TPA: N-6 DNA methylase [Thermoanaerobaculia bacterium]|nr:N-6 DNA methylase [Thermoanaerobaculia bacterium]